MGSALPLLTLQQFRDQLRKLSPVALPDEVYAALHRHYSELRRWNPRLSLVGPGTAHEVLSRHYGESLAALPLIRTVDRKLVDLGSGAGFPGLVLAASCANLEVILVELRQRKWAFLRSSLRRMRSEYQRGLSCSCLNARVGRLLPEGFPTEVDLVTSRALAINRGILEAVAESSPRARFLLWQGKSLPALPPPLAVNRELALGGSEHRKIVEICRK